MSNDIDWSKAPEGATHYSKDRAYPWLRDGDIPEYFCVDKWEQYDDVHIGKEHIRESVRIEWTGTGLPPVGTVCEYAGSMEGLKHGDTVEIIYHFNAGMAEVAAFLYWNRGGRYVGQAIAGCFRPIRTPEQIAAEEREKAVQEMLALDPYLPDTSLGMMSRADFCRTLYDAGYRKTEAAK